MTKCYRRGRIQRSKSCLKILLRAIEDFESIIKKHILFFNEIQRFRPAGQVCDDDQQASNCISYLKDTIMVVYDAIKELETDYTIAKKFERAYEPIEDLWETEYFTKDLESFSAKSIKEFLNLFQFVQSQYLSRLGLIVASGGYTESFIQYNTIHLTRLIEEQTHNSVQNFEIIVFGSNPDKHIYNFKKLNEMKQIPNDLMRAKSYCMSFVPKLQAVTHQCVRLQLHLHRAIEHFDETDKDRDDFFNLLPLMSQLDSELLMCQDEFQRLFITYQKFLNMEPEEEPASIESSNEEVDSKHVERVEHDNRKVAESVFGHHDEFFALDGYADDEKPPIKDALARLDEDDELVNRKIVKRTFKPVLKQLKQRIEPLAEDMKERERKVLTAKGVKFEDDVTNGSHKPMNATDSESGEEEEGDDEERRQKAKKYYEKYNEMKSILEQKQQVNLFAMQPPQSKMMDEDVYCEEIIEDDDGFD